MKYSLNRTNFGNQICENGSPLELDEIVNKLNGEIESQENNPIIKKEKIFFVAFSEPIDLSIGKKRDRSDNERIGVFYVSTYLIEKASKILNKILQELEFVPIKVTCFGKFYEYIGLSNKFDKLKNTKLIPLYILTATLYEDKDKLTMDIIKEKESITPKLKT